MSSNCNKFRFLIQQQFDVDLTPQDERMLMSHLDQCESCAKFQHQLQQVIMAAEEVPLPDEYLPPNPEALARTIMSELPAQKSSFFAKLLEPLTAMFAGKGKKDSPTDSGIAFPHVSRGKQPKEKHSKEEQSDSDGRGFAKPKGANGTDHTGTTNRLRNIASKQPLDENRELQSGTKSLGEKLGFAAPPGGFQEEQPLTLAESIRRKISESQKPAVDEGEQEEDSPMPAGAQGMRPPANMASPPANMAAPPANMASPPQMMNFPPKTQASQPLPDQGVASPQVMGQWGQAAPMEAPPEWGAQQAAVEQGATTEGAGQAWGGTWNEPPKGSRPAEQNSDWGPPPQGGQWDEPAQPTSNNWGGATTPAVVAPAPTVQGFAAPEAPPAPPWGAPTTPSAAMAPAAQPAAPSQDANWGANGPQAGWSEGQAGGGWGEPPAEPGKSAPSPAAQPLVQASSPQPGAQSPAVPSGAWSQPPAWGEQDSNPAAGGWGQPPAAPDQNSWGQTPAPAAASGADASWAQPPASPGAAEGSWAQPAPATASGAGWGQPADAQGANWGAQPAPAAEASWGQSPQAPAGNSWGQPPQQPAQGQDSWAQPNQAPGGDWLAAQPAAASAEGTRGQAPGGSNGGWGETPTAPAAGNGSWGQPAPAGNENGGWGQSPAQGANWGQPPAAPAGEPGWGQQNAPDAKKPTYSIDAEQLETGTWRAFTPGIEQLGAAPAKAAWAPQQANVAAVAASSTGAQPAPQAQGQGQSFPASSEQPNRWDIPIQERMKMEGPGQPAAALAPAGQGQAPAPAGQLAPPPGWPTPQQPGVATAGQPQAPGVNWNASAMQAPAQTIPAPQMMAPPQMVPQGQQGAQDMASRSETVPISLAAAQQVVAQAQSMAPQQPAQQPAPNPFAASRSETMPLPGGSLAASAAAASAAQPQGGGLFQNFDDSAIDKLFSENLGISDDGGPAPAGSPAGQPPAPQPGGWPSAAPIPAMRATPTAPPAPPQMPQAPTPQQAQQPAPLFGQQPPQQSQPMAGFAGMPQPGAPVEQSGMPRISAVQSKSMERPAGMMPGMPDQPFAPQPAPPAAPAPVQGNGLFQLDDSAMDKLFAENLGVNEEAVPIGVAQASGPPPTPLMAAPQVAAGNPFASMQTNQTPPAPPPPPGPMARPNPPAIQTPVPPWPAAPAQPAIAPPQAPQVGGLFSIDDSVIDKIFADNTINKDAAAAPVHGANEAAHNFAEAPQAPAPPPKIEGVGRLDTRAETPDVGSGIIASIGKFLLDQKDLEKIGKLTTSDINETKMRILTMEAAGELQGLLHHIGTLDKVVGSVIVGHDGNFSLLTRCRPILTPNQSECGRGCLHEHRTCRQENGTRSSSPDRLKNTEGLSSNS